MTLTFNKELASKVLIYFGGAVLAVSIGRCAYNFYTFRKMRDQTD